MIPAWLTMVLEGAGTLLRALLGTKTAPTAADQAARAATAEAHLDQEKSANDILEAGAAARAAADAHGLPGSGPANSVTVDPAAPVNTSPDAHFRD